MVLKHSSTIFIFSSEVFKIVPIVPTLAGQYIIKDIVLISAGILIGSTVRGGKMIADPENHLPNNRFNEGKCDPAGRFWAGTMSLIDEPNAGNVYSIHLYSLYSALRLQELLWENQTEYFQLNFRNQTCR